MPSFSSCLCLLLLHLLCRFLFFHRFSHTRVLLGPVHARWLLLFAFPRNQLRAAGARAISQAPDKYIHCLPDVPTWRAHRSLKLSKQKSHLWPFLLHQICFSFSVPCLSEWHCYPSCYPRSSLEVDLDFSIVLSLFNQSPTSVLTFSTLKPLG